MSDKVHSNDEKLKEVRVSKANAKSPMPPVSVDVNDRIDNIAESLDFVRSTRTNPAFFCLYPSILKIIKSELKEIEDVVVHKAGVEFIG